MEFRMNNIRGIIFEDNAEQFPVIYFVLDKPLQFYQHIRSENFAPSEIDDYPSDTEIDQYPPNVQDFLVDHLSSNNSSRISTLRSWCTKNPKFATCHRSFNTHLSSKWNTTRNLPELLSISKPSYPTWVGRSSNLCIASSTLGLKCPTGPSRIWFPH